MQLKALNMGTQQFENRTLGERNNGTKGVLKMERDTWTTAEQKNGSTGKWDNGTTDGHLRLRRDEDGQLHLGMTENGHFPP